MATDVAWGAVFAAALQSDQYTVDATLAAVTSPLDSVYGGGGAGDDGIVLGVATAGTGETGITIPNLVRESLEKPDVVTSFTKTANTYLRTNVQSLAIAFEFKGNDQTPTPAVGEAKPFEGIHAVLEMAGLIGANGGAGAEYDYTPRHQGSSGGATKYGTVRIWTGGQSFCFGGCVLESLAIPFIGGEAVIATANVRVGFVSATGTGEVTLPTANYGSQASLSAPVLESAAYSWGTSRGAESMTVTINNTIAEHPDMNVTDTGLRLVQSDRTINVDGAVYMDGADDDFEYQELIATDAPTADATWRMGTAGTTPLNGLNVAANNLEVTDVKYRDAGDVTVAEVSSHCTGTSAGSEFTLTFD